MSADDELISLRACALPGTVEVACSALTSAEQFQASIPRGYIVAFIWVAGRRVKASKDAPWVDQGPGLTLGAYRNAQIPEEAVCHAGSFRYAVLIGKETIASYPRKMIDLDDGGKPILR